MSILVTFLALILQVCSEPIITVDCSPKTADILFILDSSDKIDLTKFNEATTQSIPQIIKKLSSSSVDLAISVITYSDKIEEVIPLQKIFDIQLIEDKLNNLERRSSISKPIKALEKSIEVFKNLDTISPKICLWFTDGVLMDDQLSLINKRANSLKNHCHLFIFNIGKNSNKPRLMKFASAPSFVFNLNELQDFYPITKNIIAVSCFEFQINKSKRNFNGRRQFTLSLKSRIKLKKKKLYCNLKFYNIQAGMEYFKNDNRILGIQFCINFNKTLFQPVL